MSDALDVFEASRRSGDDVLAVLGARPEGLSNAEAEERLRVARPRGSRLTAAAWLAAAQAGGGTCVVAVAAAVASALLGDGLSASLAAAVGALGVFAEVFERARARRATEAVLKLVRTSATVMRDGVRRRLPASELVVGDIVQLSAGGMVPADVRVLKARNLVLSEISLTGEALPVEKDGESLAAKNGAGAAGGVAAAARLRNIGLMGANVVSGVAMAVVLRTAASMPRARGESEFSRQESRVRRMALGFAVAAALAVFVALVSRGTARAEALLVAFATVVALAPHALRSLAVGSLARAGRVMARGKLVVKTPLAVEPLATIDVLCADKTGLLTEDLVVFGGAFGPFGNEDEVVLQKAYLNSIFQTGLRNFLDLAIIRQVEKAGGEAVLDHQFVDELPFDFVRKRVSVIVESRVGRKLLICKGAVDEVLTLCSTARSKGAIVPLDASTRSICATTARIMNEKEYRLLALAYKDLPDDRSTCEPSDESDLILLGYVAFLDPPVRPTAKEEAFALARNGVALKILTADGERVTAKIAREAGMTADARLLGSEIDAMSASELAAAVDTTTIFARLSPHHKERIIRALQSRGRVVGFLGDAINDAPALRVADVGLSVSDAVDAAREAADVILLEKTIPALHSGVLEARKAFVRIRRGTLQGLIHATSAAAWAVLASLALPFAPFRASQLLTRALLLIGARLAFPYDHVDDETVAGPRRWVWEGLTPVLALGAALSFAVEAAACGLSRVSAFPLPREAVDVRAGWFVATVGFQIVLYFSLRTSRLPFFRSRPALRVAGWQCAVALVAAVLPYTAFGPSLGLAAPAMAALGVLAGAVVFADLVFELAKRRASRQL